MRTYLQIASRITILLCAVLFTASGVAFAQGTASRVTGTVVDQKGSSMPGATVTLTNEGTQVSFNTRTSDTGNYVFDSVQVGVYTIMVEKQGFKKFISSGNKIEVNLPATVNVTLEVGSVEETVQVVGAAEQVQTSSSGNFGQTVEQRSLETLPIVGSRGRNPFNFTLDGIDINETSAGGSNFTPLRPNPDMLSEFQVLTSNFTAELGRSSGAQVALVTRSGSNDFHGSAFEFYRTPRLNANEFENKQQ